MKVHALTVCVNYADLLAVSLPRWLAGVDSLTVVTTPQDRETEALCYGRHRCTRVTTDLFYADGAAFNKGRAMEYALQFVRQDDWLLFFDSDIVPPADWRAQVEAAKPQPGKLYGAHRWQAADASQIDRPDLPPMVDAEFAGFFQLFHTSDPAVQQRPLLDTTWIHAGNYDSTFQDRWGRGSSTFRKVRLPLRLIHLGEPGLNWWGRGPDALAKTAAMKLERRRRGGWQHERIGS